VVSRKFASLTGDLLARKGEAAPSLARERAQKPSTGWAAQLKRAFVSDITSGKRSRKKRRAKNAGEDGGGFILALTPSELEMLDLAASKNDTSANALIRDALVFYLDHLSREWASDDEPSRKHSADGSG
jgi:hypothetical protein